MAPDYKTLKANHDALLEVLADAADALDQVTDWMDDFALLKLGDDADGGNIMCEGLKMKAEEIRTAIKASKLMEKR